jgi:hypothetical protein
MKTLFAIDAGTALIVLTTLLLTLRLKPWLEYEAVRAGDRGRVRRGLLVLSESLAPQWTARKRRSAAWLPLARTPEQTD